MSSCQRANSGGTSWAPGAQKRFGFCSVSPTARSPSALPVATAGERVSAGVGGVGCVLLLFLVVCGGFCFFFFFFFFVFLFFFLFFFGVWGGGGGGGGG